MTGTSPRLRVGDTLHPRILGPITQTDIVRFAGAGGDFNPLHHDPEHARAAGMPGVVSMGQLQAGMLAAWVSDLVGVENLLRFSVRFSSPLAIGETLELTGRVESVEDAEAVLGIEARVDDRVVISGGAVVRYRRAG